MGDIIQPETRQDSLPNCSASLCFLLHSTILKGAMYLTQAEQKKVLMIQVWLFFSQHLYCCVESIPRIKEAPEQRWKQSMWSILMKCQMRRRCYTSTVHRGGDRVTLSATATGHQSLKLDYHLKSFSINFNLYFRFHFIISISFLFFHEEPNTNIWTWSLTDSFCANIFMWLTVGIPKQNCRIYNLNVQFVIDYVPQ